MAHARLSPSSAHRWMRCPGSVVLSDGTPDRGSAYAAEGTVAHDFGAKLLEDPTFEVPVGDTVEADGFHVHVTPEMKHHVHDYAKLVREYAGDGLLMAEQKVSIGHLTGEDGATGTSDVIIVKGTELIVIDLKYGMGLKVFAEENEQLQMYALGAYAAVELLHDITEVTMVIHQPRLNHVSEWTISLAKLLEFAEDIAAAAAQVSAAADLDFAVNIQGSADGSLMDDGFLSAGEKQCKFCAAKATCPALKAEVFASVSSMAAASAADFADLVAPKVAADTDGGLLAEAMSKVKLIEGWCDAVRAETERRLLSGTAVVGFKLVQGRGTRKWTEEEKVEKILKGFRFRVDDIYERKLVSPAKAEKLLKEKPERWEKVKPFITQSDGKPSVALATDARPAMATMVADDFRDLAQTAK